jgi:hypothetical protein
MTMTLSFVLELMLTVLLAVTLLYCIVLERRLAAVRKGQDNLKGIIGELNASIGKAGAALAALKAASGNAAGTLDERIKHARALADELSLLTASGERIAERFDRAVSTKPVAAASPHLPSGSVMHRLDALRSVR